MPSVEIEQSGRGGSIYYHEGKETIIFGWEFALSPALALIFGPTAQVWASAHPWAAMRQAEIYETVGEEVVRQKAPGCAFKVNLDEGVIEILTEQPKKPARRARAKKGVTAPVAPKHSEAFEQFLASVVPIWEHWRDDQTYDVAAIAKMKSDERQEAFSLLTSRDVTWREVEALAAIDTPEARAAVDRALEDHLSIDTRLAAAEVMHRDGRLPDMDGFLARQIRQLYQPRNGLERTLRLAAQHPSETVKQALLWASYNQTECAPSCARLLLDLTGAAKEPFDAATEQMLEKLGLHNSYFDRQAAFEELCRRVGMKFDPQAGE
ncbi:MAG: hypothetical protein ACE145_03260 [Terriglobia bacterium]